MNEKRIFTDFFCRKLFSMNGRRFFFFVYLDKSSPSRYSMAMYARSCSSPAS